MASTLHTRTGISPSSGNRGSCFAHVGAHQHSIAVGSMNTLTAEACAKHSFNCQLHTAHVVTVDTLPFSSVALTAGNQDNLLSELLFLYYGRRSLYRAKEDELFAKGGSSHMKMAGLLLVSYRE